MYTKSVEVVAVPRTFAQQEILNRNQFQLSIELSFVRSIVTIEIFWFVMATDAHTPNTPNGVRTFSCNDLLATK